MGATGPLDHALAGSPALGAFIAAALTPDHKFALLYIPGTGKEKREITLEVSAIGAAESLVTLFVGFASLTAAWLLVAAGMGRQSD